MAVNTVVPYELAILHYEKEIHGLMVHFMKIDKAAAFVFVKNGLHYGTFVEIDVDSEQRTKEVFKVLEVNAEESIALL